MMLIPFQSLRAQQYSRGVGVYPGDPSEVFSPSMKIDSMHYRDLAHLRPVYQSSAYDYNLTGQLITDGIIDTTLPGWIVTSTSDDGILGRDGREHLLDRHGTSHQSFEGPSIWYQVEMAGNYDIPSVDSLSLTGSVTLDTLTNSHWELSITGSNNGKDWQMLAEVNADTLPGEDALANLLKRFPSPGNKPLTAEQMHFLRSFAPRNRRILNYHFKLEHKVHYKFYRFAANDPAAQNWDFGIFGIYNDGQYARIGGPYHFTSAWKSAGSKQEWVYVDLGAVCSFNRVKLYWIRRALQGSVQVSDDAVHWKTIAHLPNHSNNIDDIEPGKMVHGRYVRLLMTRAAFPTDGYILSEMQIMGTGGPVPVAHRQAVNHIKGRLELAGGSWRLQRSTLVEANGTTLSQPGYNDSKWPIATVPATILVSYLNDGALPDPNYADNQLLISDSYFYSDFWYRDVFTAPQNYKGKRVYLNFDGINWEAEAYLNGHDLGRINGSFIRGKFDVTSLLKPGAQNVLAVRIIKNDTPGFPTEQNRNSPDANGGELGADNPTFHASIGWDWIPTIRGRDTGIWNDVYLTDSGSVTLENPFVSIKLPLPDTTSAYVSVQITLHNHVSQRIKGVLKGSFGTTTFEKSVTLEPAETKTITLDPATNPSLRLHNPRLWWPNGYGKQNLYKVKLAFVTDNGQVSDSKSFKTGVREMTYSEKGGALRIWVNGRRFIGRGGNWGFSESLLRYRSREYNIAVRYHKDMNFTMIRNWVGQTADDAFYQACDKYGIMVWQDFWLANPVDGPNPIHPQMFISNLKDYVKRIRNHPSVALYVGRNEGNPPPVIESAIRRLLPKLDPGIRYIPNSAFGVVSGGGPYHLMMPLTYYFKNRATPKLHSEIGMPDIVSYESLRRMMPDSDMWPQSRMWGVHDFTLQGAQNGDTFNKTIEQTFGKVNKLKKWLSLAAWMEYQGYRAMFEAQSKHRMGLLLWMSHPAWPSLTWQTYDYYFDPTAAYFASKKASEPLHIQWNPLSDSVEVVNYSVEYGSGLTATMQILDMDGSVKKKEQTTVSCPEDSTIHVFPVDLPDGLSPVYFVRLELRRGNQLISRNTYMRGLSADKPAEIGDLKAATELPDVRLSENTQTTRRGNEWILRTTLKNNSRHPALIVRLNIVGDQSGKQLLPVIYSDNYFSLLPGESRTITMELKNADTLGEKPVVKVDGLNVKKD